MSKRSPFSRYVVAAAVNLTALMCATGAVSATYDIGGVKLGMTPDQARRTIQATGQGWSFSVTKLPNGKIDTVNATRQAKSGITLGERILVQFNASSGTAWYVGHNITYEESERPLVNALIQGYLQKFGTPAFSDPRINALANNRTDPVFLWSDDANGQALKSTRRLSTRCIGDEGSSVPGADVSDGIMGAPALSYPNEVPDNCGFTAYANVSRNSFNKDIARSLAVWIADMHMRYVELSQEQTTAASKDAADRANANKKAASIKPKL